MLNKNRRQRRLQNILRGGDGPIEEPNTARFFKDIDCPPLSEMNRTMASKRKESFHEG
jgi:hypothetical protein